MFSQKTAINEALINESSSNNELKLLNYKKETSLWEFDSTIEIFKESSLKIRSLDGVATFIYNPNDFYFEVEYFILLPKKKMLLPTNKEKFYTKPIGYSSHSEKPFFEYMKTRKIFNVYESPARWQILLLLCMRYCQQNSILMKCEIIYYL